MTLSLSRISQISCLPTHLNCAAVYAPGLFLLGVLYITPLRVKKPHLGGILLLAALGLAEFVALVCVLTR